MGTLSPAEAQNAPNSCAAVGTKGGFMPSEAKQQRHLKANRYYNNFSPALTSEVLSFSYHSKIKSLQEKALSSGEVSVRFVLLSEVCLKLVSHNNKTAELPATAVSETCHFNRAALTATFRTAIIITVVSALTTRLCSPENTDVNEWGDVLGEKRKRITLTKFIYSSL